MEAMNRVPQASTSRTAKAVANGVHTQAPQRKRVSVLGATGSVGRSTLDLIGRNPDRFEVCLLYTSDAADE